MTERAALIEIVGGAVVAVRDLPFKWELKDGGTALLEKIGQEVPDHAPAYRVVRRVEVNFDRPGTYYAQGADVETRDGDTITVTRQWRQFTAQEIAEADAALRDFVVAGKFDNVDGIGRAAVLVILDELNLHSTRLAAILQAAADATSLADFKARMAQIQPIAQRTPAQIRTAIRNKLGS